MKHNELALSPAAAAQVRANFPLVVIDEGHQQAWSTRADRASAMNPSQPADASLARAVEHLTHEGFTVVVNETPFAPGSLPEHSVLVLPHFSDPRFERTTGIGIHRLTDEEIEVVDQHVRHGGGLVVLAEHEHDKYGTNLNVLLARFGVQVRHCSVIDTVEHRNGVVAWIQGTPTSPTNGILSRVKETTFYRAGVLDVDAPDADVLVRTGENADPADAPVIVTVRHGAGRVVVVADSDLFGDDSIRDGDHLQLLANLVTWSSATVQDRTSDRGLELPTSWYALKDSVTALRAVQSNDGSVDLTSHDPVAVTRLAESVLAAYAEVARLHPHDAAFHDAVGQDMRRWIDGGFAVPDFLDSLLLFNPDKMRTDGLEHIVCLPFYTQNGNLDRVFEAVWIRTVWPDWIAELEAGGFRNPAFVPISFVDFTAGYDTHSAVLFPETVAVRETPKFTWGGIFCDREAARFRVVTKEAAGLLRLALPPDAELLLNDPRITQETFVLWDLVHDRQHSLGELPFDPFMIKQRIPFWMYSLEELRCDLAAYGEMDRIAELGVPHARLVKYAVLFDRLLRFPITGQRVKNYDGLVGQIIFAHLHRNGVLRWADNALTIEWDLVDAAIADLSQRINELYRTSIDRSRVGFWAAAHELVRELVPAHPASRWQSGLDWNVPVRELVDAVLPDEFPLNVFYEALAKKLGGVIESTRGATL
jgi:hypothetical protein